MSNEYERLCSKCEKLASDNHINKSISTYILSHQHKNNSTSGINITSDKDDTKNVKAKPGSNRLSIMRHSIVKESLLINGSLNDHYEIIESCKNELGKGSFGKVVKAIERSTGQFRAIKTVYKPRVENISRLKREISIMKKLDHPCIIRLYNVYEDDINLYLIMELCTGGELFDRIVKNGRMSERSTYIIIKQLISAVAYCHRLKILHRDIKPENVLFANTDANSPIKMIDWGFAAQCESHSVFNSVVGTPYYVAPEVLQGRYNFQCDIWSTGVVMYILLCGYPPFQGKCNKEILANVKTGNYSMSGKVWHEVSLGAKDLLRRFLTLNPSERITAEQALCHPWIKSYASPSFISCDSKVALELGNELIKKFHQFSNACQLKRLALAAVAYQLGEHEILALHNLYVRIDRHSNGAVTVDEFALTLSEMGITITEEIRKLIDTVDLDGNGLIDYTEFIAACLDARFYQQKSICRSAFKVFDIDQDSIISFDDLKTVVKLSFGHVTDDQIHNLLIEAGVTSSYIVFDQFREIMAGIKSTNDDFTQLQSQGESKNSEKHLDANEDTTGSLHDKQTDTD